MLAHIYELESEFLNYAESLTVYKEEAYRLIGHTLANYQCWLDKLLEEEDDMAATTKKTKKSTKKSK